MEIVSFNSRTPGGVRLTDRFSVNRWNLFQFTHPGRGATSFTPREVSIKRRFNSRTPGGVRHRESMEDLNIRLFQFTHPGRGATRALVSANTAIIDVSIHAPREGCDSGRVKRLSASDSFNSRTPGGVRLSLQPFPSPCLPVSIHAPREGCDLSVVNMALLDTGFNSRTPGGVRLIASQKRTIDMLVSIHAPREGCDIESGPSAG